MIHITLTKLLLIAGALLGLLALIFESVAFDNDIKWNNWLDQRIKKNIPPTNLISRSVQETIVFRLYRDSWYEPTALTCLAFSLIVQFTLILLVYWKRLKEDSDTSKSVLTFVTALHLLILPLILESYLEYELTYAYLVHAYYNDTTNVTHGAYRELSHCQTYPSYISAQYPKPAEHACQSTVLKNLTVCICTAVICIHVVFCAVAAISDILDGKIYPMDYSSVQECTEKDDEPEGEDVPENSEGVREQEVSEEVVFVIPPEELAEMAPARTSAASKSSGGSNPPPLNTSPSYDGVT